MPIAFRVTLKTICVRSSNFGVTRDASSIYIIDLATLRYHLVLLRYSTGARRGQT